MKKQFTYYQRNPYTFSLILLTLVSLFWMSCNGPSSDYGARLEAGFIIPPDSAKPRVWWHWMNGNVTKEGIHADLEWMHRAGIGGFQNFDAGLTTPSVVEKRLVYMTPEWKDAFRFTVNLADSLGLEMAIAGSPGWSESGGPWVKPEEAMKKFVWTETRIEGGKSFSGVLPKPPSVAGPFQNLGLMNEFGGRGNSTPLPEYYADAAVVAYRLPDSDLSMASLQPKITSSGGKFSLADLTDGDLVKSSFLPAAKIGESSWIQYEFAEPVAMQAITIVGGAAESMFRPADEIRTLEFSVNGKEFHKIIEIPGGSIRQKTLSFDPIKAKFFRVTWEKLPVQEISIPGLSGLGFGRVPQGPAGTQVAELVLYSSGHVNRFEDKAAFDAATDLYKAFTPEVSPGDVVKKADVS